MLGRAGKTFNPYHPGQNGDAVDGVIVEVGFLAGVQLSGEFKAASGRKCGNMAKHGMGGVLAVQFSIRANQVHPALTGAVRGQLAHAASHQPLAGSAGFQETADQRRGGLGL